jgi:hypothetical protein
MYTDCPAASSAPCSLCVAACLLLPLLLWPLLLLLLQEQGVLVAGV